MSNHILIKYKTIEYKVARNDSISYENIVNFLIEAIDVDADTSLNLDIEYTGYWPDQDSCMRIRVYTSKIRISHANVYEVYAQFKLMAF